MAGERATAPETGPYDRTEPVALGVLDGFVGYHLRLASSAFAADFSRAMSGTGMRQVLLGILSVVAANPGVSQASVGRVLAVQPANMVALITELVDRGLIVREAAANRRAFALTVTDAGAALLNTCVERIAEHEGRMLAGLSPDERATLLKLLARVGAAGC